MGLTIVLAIAEAHGGTARLMAPGSGGARFEILVPLAENHTPADVDLGR